MAAHLKHVLQQGPSLAALGRTFGEVLKQQLSRSKAAGPMVLPSEAYTATITPRPRALVRDYIAEVGGDPAAYEGAVPAHFFPQWSFGLAARTLEGLPYPLAKVVNGGCRIEINDRIPDNESLSCSARLESVDDNGRRAVLEQRVVTGTNANPEALVATMYPIVPLSSKGKGKSEGPKKPRPAVPEGARELARWELPRTAGRDFAILTGDFNPIHWITPYARMSGFKRVILHGFATMARAIEGLNGALFDGDPTRLAVFDCRFTKPLLLPGEVGLYVDDEGGVWVGDAAGAPAYLTGTYETKGDA